MPAGKPEPHRRTREEDLAALNRAVFMRESQAAAAVYRDLTTRDPRFALSGPIQFDLARLLELGGEAALALHAYECLIEREPNHPSVNPALRAAGHLCSRLKQYDKCRFYLERFLQSDPITPERRDAEEILARLPDGKGVPKRSIAASGAEPTPRPPTDKTPSSGVKFEWKVRSSQAGVQKLDHRSSRREEPAPEPPPPPPAPPSAPVSREPEHSGTGVVLSELLTNPEPQTTQPVMPAIQAALFDNLDNPPEAPPAQQAGYETLGDTPPLGIGARSLAPPPKPGARKPPRSYSEDWLQNAPASLGGRPAPEPVQAPEPPRQATPNTTTVRRQVPASDIAFAPRPGPPAAAPPPAPPFPGQRTPTPLPSAPEPSRSPSSVDWELPDKPAAETIEKKYHRLRDAQFALVIPLNKRIHLESVAEVVAKREGVDETEAKKRVLSRKGIVLETLGIIDVVELHPIVVECRQALEFIHVERTLRPYELFSVLGGEILQPGLKLMTDKGTKKVRWEDIRLISCGRFNGVRTIDFFSNIPCKHFRFAENSFNFRTLGLAHRDEGAYVEFLELLGQKCSRAARSQTFDTFASGKISKPQKFSNDTEFDTYNRWLLYINFGERVDAGELASYAKATSNW